jgi:hypothetical protein
MKQTAVEWLAEQLEQHHIKIDIKNTVVFQQAKAMEKEQIIDAYIKGQSDCEMFTMQSEAEQYYNETYGN